LGSGSVTEDVAIGLDVGGTKIAAGLVAVSSGAILEKTVEPTAKGGPAQLEQALRLAAEIHGLLGRRAQGAIPVGLGLPELVAPDGTIFSDQRLGWKGLPLRDHFARIGPARVEADVRAAALAEARLGAGRGLRHFLYATIGTGMSAVLVQDGTPYSGSRGAALVIASGPALHKCAVCGHVDHRVLEDWAAGPGLARSYGVERAEDVIRAAEAGDARAATLVTTAAEAVGHVLAVLSGTLDPEAVVLGGGLGSAPGPYARALTEAFDAARWAGGGRPVPVFPAKLGADSGLVGAALAAFDHRTTWTSEPINTAEGEMR
jgi:glucokinase